MIAEPAPGIILANFHGSNSLCKIGGGKAIVNMIGFVAVPVHIQGRMTFRSLQLVMIGMVCAKNALALQQIYHVRMVALPPRLIPDGVAIKVADEDYFLAG